jgi:lipid-A-disaccharide synthase
MQATITIISNGPGELATWVRPVVRVLHGALPGVKLRIALVPCPYASGQEAETIAHWGGEIEVWRPEETLRRLFLGPLPERGPGAVLFMGGDQAFGVSLAQRLRQPLLVYTETTGRWAPFVTRFLTSDPEVSARLQKLRVPSSKVAMVGNLMVDAVKRDLDPHQTRRALGLNAEEMIVGLLPGSKPFKVKFITPLLLRAAELMHAENPGLQFVLHQSPWTPLDQIAEAASSEHYASVTGGTTARMVTNEDRAVLITPQGAQIRILPPEHHLAGMAIADLAMTVPGTNTAELAILGVPMLVLLPLNKPEEIPLDGLPGQVGNLPLVGKWLKRQLVQAVARRTSLTALPNVRAGRMITPELKGVFPPEEVSRTALELLASPSQRREIKLALSHAMGPAGAAEAVVAQLAALLGALPPAGIPEVPTPEGGPRA